MRRSMYGREHGKGTPLFDRGRSAYEATFRGAAWYEGLHPADGITARFRNYSEEKFECKNTKL